MGKGEQNMMFADVTIPAEIVGVVATGGVLWLSWISKKVIHIDRSLLKLKTQLGVDDEK